MYDIVIKEWAACQNHAPLQKHSTGQSNVPPDHEKDKCFRNEAWYTSQAMAAVTHCLQFIARAKLYQCLQSAHIMHLPTASNGKGYISERL